MGSSNLVTYPANKQYENYAGQTTTAVNESINLMKKSYYGCESILLYIKYPEMLLITSVKNCVAHKTMDSSTH
jgi:hypothetical protein